MEHSSIFPLNIETTIVLVCSCNDDPSPRHTEEGPAGTGYGC